MNIPANLRGLLGAQFLGAFNDNAWKLIVGLLAIRALGASPSETSIQEAFTIAFVVFTLPLTLFSLPASWLVDRFSRRSILVTAKAGEIGILSLATLCLAVDPQGTVGPLVCLGLTGLQSAIFSPAKGALLPDLVPHDRLSATNGLLELVSFVAIVFGTWAGGFMLNLTGEDAWRVAAALTLLSCVGFALIRHVPEPPARPRTPSAGNLRASAKALMADRRLRWATLGAAGYWATVSLVGQNLLTYGKASSGLGLSDAWAGLPLALCGLGAGVGCVAAGRLSGGKVEIGLVPLGALLLTGLFAMFAALMPGLSGTLAIAFASGAVSGLIVVPLSALMQWAAPAERRGGVLAVSNAIVFGGVMLGSLAAGTLAEAGFGVSQVQWCATGLALLGAASVTFRLPGAGLRVVLWMITRTVYRLKILHGDRIPTQGGALLVANHVSLVDAILVQASTDRPVRFVMARSFYDKWWVAPFARALQAIPIETSGSHRSVLRALKDAGSALDEGELVCIFAEGQLTRQGQLLPFRRGLERIVKGRDVPVLPVYLDRLWGSIFSHSDGAPMRRWPTELPRRATVVIGEALEPSTPANEVRQVLHELGPEAWQVRKSDGQTLGRRFLKGMRRAPWRVQFVDGDRVLSRWRVAAGAIAMGRVLDRKLLERPVGGLPSVGVMLPPSLGGALVDLGLTIGGRVPVHLNFTAGTAAVASAIRQTGMKQVVTSRVFLEKIQFELPEHVEVVEVESLVASIGKRDRLRAALAAWVAPMRWIERSCGLRRKIDVDEPATVLFSSGSTGAAKGVVLSHFNIASNVEGLAQVVPQEKNARLLGVLPFFHSFGKMALHYSCNEGVGTVFYPNPTDAAAVGSLIDRHQVTMLLSTPTFLQLYLRRCEPAQFGSLQMVVAGAEKLSARLADAFEDRFGLRPLEGYGATECSPVVSVSTRDVRQPGVFQAGSRRGTVGRPLPGVAIRIVDPDTRAPLPIGEAGLLLVRGPNVMQGYLGREDATAKVLVDGWYETGDIARIDEDGFVTITDRLARFSKIGGEMVPHGTVETALQGASGYTEPVVAVTAVPDAKKGERLVVVTTLEQDSWANLIDGAARTGLPNLFLPRETDFVSVDGIPILGTGKMDLGRIRKIATEAFAA